MITKQEGRLSKLDATMQQTAEMMQQLMQVTGANDQQTKVLTGRVDEIGAKTDQIIAALKTAGVVFPQTASSETQQTHGDARAAPGCAHGCARGCRRHN